jgi:hypothetical protein
MKTSNAVLLTVFIVLAAVIIIAAVGFRIGFARIGFDTESGGFVRRAEKPGDLTEERYDLRDFDSLRIRGPWTVTLTQGEAYSVEVRFPANYRDRIEVYTQRDDLIVEVEPFTISGITKLSIEVTMPYLEDIRVMGAVDMGFSGFESEEVEITIDGAGDVTGIDNVIEELSVTVDGAVNVDLKKSTCKNADVVLNGAGNVDLTMAGGVLSGRIDGLGVITYAGKVTEQTVQLHGLGSVERR